MHGVELGVVILYFLTMLLIGWWFRWASTRSEASFWVAERSVGALVNGVAIFSAIGSAATFMGFVAVGYVYGLPMSLACAAGAAVGYAFALISFAGPLRRLGGFTLGDFFEMRYGGQAIRIVYSLITVVFFFVYLIPQLKGGGLVLQYLLGLPYWQGVILIGFVYVIYVVLGGMLAITWTDFIQGLLMFLFAVGLGAFILAEFGGSIGNVLQSAVAADPHFAYLSPKMSFWSVLGFALSMVFFMGASPHVVMRQYTVRNPHAGRVSVLIAVIMMDIFVGLFAYTMILAAAKIHLPPLKDPDFITLAVMDRYFSPILKGLSVAAILAAIQSTTDAMLLAIGAAVGHDIYKRLIRPGAEAKSVFWVARVVMLVAGILAIIIALRPPGLIGVIVGLITGGIGASFFFPLWLGIWWERTTRAGALAGMVGGFVAFVVFQLGGLVPLFTAALVGVAASLVVTVVVSLLTAPATDEVRQLVKQIRA